MLVILYDCFEHVINHIYVRINNVNLKSETFSIKKDKTDFS